MIESQDSSVDFSRSRSLLTLTRSFVGVMGGVILMELRVLSRV